VRGRVVRYGSGWRYVVDLGKQPRQRCAVCGRTRWADRVSLSTCPHPGCSGRMVDEGLQRRQVARGGFLTQKAAQKALTAELKALHDGQHVNPDDVTLREYVEDEWLPLVRAGKRKATTVALYEMILNCYVLPRIGDKRLQQLRGRHLSRLYADLRESGRASKSRPGGLGEHSLGNVRAVLHRILRDAVRSGILVRSPAEDVVEAPSHRSTARPMQTWGTEELAAFLAHVDVVCGSERVVKGTRKSRAGREYTYTQTKPPEPMQRALWYLVALSGMRRGEVCGLRWPDLDLQAGVASVSNALVLVGNKAVDSTPKTASSRRMVALAPQVVAVLAEWQQQQAREREHAGDAWRRGGDYVFTWQDGSPVRPDYVTRDFRRVAKAAGLPVIRLHDLRHGYATISLQRGVHPKVVADGLGHSSIDVTMDVYSHVIPSVQRQAADMIAGAILAPHVQTPRDYSRDYLAGNQDAGIEGGAH